MALSGGRGKVDDILFRKYKIRNSDPAQHRERAFTLHARTRDWSRIV